MVRHLFAVICALFLLAACAPSFEDHEAVALFHAMAPDATRSVQRFSADEAATMLDLVRAECPGLPAGAFVRATYVTDGLSLVIYASPAGNVSCAVFKQDVPPQVVQRPFALDGAILAVNGVPIRADRFRAAFPAGANVSDPAVVEQVFQQLVNDELLRQAAAGVEVSEADLARAEAVLVQLAGAADADAYLAQANLSADAFAAQVREQAQVTGLLRTRLRIDESSVSDARAREYYLANPGEFLVPERATMRHLYLRAEGRSQEELERLAGEVSARIPASDFCALVREYSDDVRENCGTFIVPRGVIAPDLEQAAFSTPANQTSVVRLQDGVHFVQSVQVSPARVLPYDEVAVDLRSSLLNSVFQQRLALYLSMLRARAEIVAYTE